MDTEEEVFDGEETPLEEEEDRIARLEAEIEALKSKEKSGTEARKTIQKEKREKSSLSERLSAIEEAQTRQVADTKESVLNDLSGGDDNEKARIQYEYDLLNMPEDTPDQVRARFQKASNMVQREGNVGPLSAGIPTSSAPNITSPKNKEFAYSPDGIDLASRLGLSYVEKK